MEADPAPDFSMMLRELLAPPCLDPEPPPEPPARQAPRPPRCLRPSGRSFWPARRDSITALHFLQETAEGLAQPPAQDTQVLGPCWELKALGSLGPPPPASDARNMLPPISQQCGSLGPPGAPLAPSAPPEEAPETAEPPAGRRESGPPVRGGDPEVSDKAGCQPAHHTQLQPGLRPPLSGSPAGPARGPEATSGGSEALGPRRCASCRTQRTPLWRDAEDGTPLCNACGIRYKKYGTRCASCWLVPRKNVQPKRLCGRCGVSLSPHQGPAQEG